MTSSTVRDVITLQFGEYSNETGAQFWNMQEAALQDATGQDEIDPRTLYRTRIQGGLTPRVVMFDGKGRFGNLTRGYVPSSESPHTWSGTLNVVNQESKKEDDHSDDSHWSSSLQATLHPTKAIHEVNTLKSFDKYHSYVDGMNRNCQEDAYEKVRYLLEDSDCVSGVQVLVDTDSGWGAYSTVVLKELRDEVRSATVMTFGIDGEYPRQEDHEDDLSESEKQSRDRRMLNTGLSMASLMEYSDLFVPIHYSKRNSLDIATAIEVATSPFRLSNFNTTSLSDVVNSVYRNNAAVAELSCVFPHTFEADELQNADKDHLVKLFNASSFLRKPREIVCNTITDQYYSSWIVLRNSMNIPSMEITKHLAKSVYSKWNFTKVSAPVYVPAVDNHKKSSDVEFFGASSSLGTNSRVTQHLCEVANDFESVGIATRQKYCRSGLESDELVEVQSVLNQMRRGGC